MQMRIEKCDAWMSFVNGRKMINIHIHAENI